MGVWPTGTCGTIIKDWQVKYKLDLSIPFFNVIPVKLLFERGREIC